MSWRKGVVLDLFWITFVLFVLSLGVYFFLPELSDLIIVSGVVGTYMGVFIFMYKNHKKDNRQ